MSQNTNKSFLGIISERGGGAIPPVIALGRELAKEGHKIAFVCDLRTEPQVSDAGFQAITIPDPFSLASYFGPPHFQQWGNVLSERGSLDSVNNPLETWSQDSFEHVVERVQELDPSLIFTSLFTLCLANDLSKHLGVPWSFINPAFAFGKGAARSIEEDFAAGIPTHLFSQWILPFVEQANLVIHATDREYDQVTADLPKNHHHVGPLNLVPPGEDDLGRLVQGEPWGLVSLSTGPQQGELDIARYAIESLRGRDLSIFVTAPQRSSELKEFEDAALIRDFASHDAILERSRIFVTHAGHGSVMKGLIHGVPMVLVPWGRDQIGVAFRAEQLGVGVVVSRSDLSPTTMNSAVDAVLGSDAMLSKARAVSRRIASEDPLGTARELLEEAAL